MQQGGIPPVGVGVQKNRCRADFQVSGTMPQFDINSGDDENRRGIEFIVPKHLFVLLRIVRGHNSWPAVQIWSWTLDKTFFLGKNMCVNICIYYQILHG